jgi:hypothetical protein
MKRTIFEFAMTKAHYAQMGLGCGLADIREVNIDLNEAKGPHRLMGFEQHLEDDALLVTRWMPITS